ncbi:ABC transporter ATP-binding protein [Paraburkholderia hospita]|jgi:peptide/nickel transport system ATP-binding protein|uniref:Oligopeptide/dipeptide ABC transporter ATPase n=1 Tax=Paraburkholderia hospita TaxID=169430 RepID=A0ABP2PJT9_9BURK|nr:ABC transporter ATP-binding protein [Paraburkholderia hospita]AXE97557.1 ABC transporter ATP-binding protein [Paraburkholderia hospita]EIM98054.1 oligopeptide/dipeptide ABC transporter ATPase [Paraburkholderia hospita]OUL74882.1 ABC transporter ATP-binding protein [Paraburkholderia hospita]OUL88022.1 ABC transporter ATP-binding protein [Paraburkholderia hospita]
MNGPSPPPPPASFPAFDVSKSEQSDALTIVGLTVAYRTRGRERDVLQDVSFRIRRGESYGLVGESGCGKSTVAMATLRYLARNGRVKAGRISIAGKEVHSLDAAALRELRANRISMVYQDPSRALNPSLTIARQVAEAFEASGATREDALKQTAEMLRKVRIAEPERVMDSYPHQLSGGMQQRVVIAMALASKPALLILDEPTTGLDATVEAEVLDLVAQLRDEFHTAVLFISHNLAVIGRMCERVGVLYAGKLVEEGATQDVFARPRHPYTVGLLRCLPTVGRSKDNDRLDTIAGSLPQPGSIAQGCIYAERCRLADDRCRREAPPPYRVSARHGDQMSRCHYHERAMELPRATPVDAPAHASGNAHETRDASPVLRAESVSKTFHVAGAALRAVDDVSLELAKGETLGLVGESGSGKTTLAKLLLGLVSPDAGSVIELDGTPLPARVTNRNDEQVKSLQIVFQNPDSALNRAHSVRRLIGRALSRLSALHGDAREERLASLAQAVRLPDRYLTSRTRQLSGGLKQRVAIARAFAGDPRIVVCDEPTSALDVSVQAAILNLLADLQRDRSVSYVFISHDLNVVRYLSDRIAVLYVGRLLEIGPASAVFDGPHHPYTEALLSSVPALDQRDGEQALDPKPQRIRLAGELPSPAAPPSGCVFHTRCPRKLGAICEQQDPPYADAGDAHRIRCHIPVDELRVLQRRN